MNENDTTEFKRELTRDSMKTVVAFSNTSGGKIHIGVDDDGNYVGLDDIDEVSKRTVQLMTDTIRPDVTEHSRIIQSTVDGKDIITINVSEGTNKPYYLHEKGLRPEGVYIRKGPTSIQASESLIRKMIRERTMVTYESAVSMEQELTFTETEKIFEECDIEFGERQMISLGLITDGAYTNLGYLLSDQCSIGMKMATFNDEGKSEFINRGEVRGSVLKQADVAFDYVNTYNPLRTTIGGKLRRTDRYAFPKDAIREAIVNAVVHRDYSINGDSLVSVIGNNVVITSIGGLNPDIGEDDIMMGISSLRNPRLANIFYRLNMIEAYGTGIPRIMDSYKGSLRKPMIQISTNVFKVTLPEAIKNEMDNRISEDILSYLSVVDSATRSELEFRTKSSRSKVNEVLQILVSENLVERVGSGRNTAYRICKRV